MHQHITRHDYQRNDCRWNQRGIQGLIPEAFTFLMSGAKGKVKEKGAKMDPLLPRGGTGKKTIGCLHSKMNKVFPGERSGHICTMLMPNNPHCV